MEDKETKHCFPLFCRRQI